MTSTRRIACTAGSLLAASLCASGCRSSAARSVIPTPTARTVTTPPGRAGVISVLTGFDRAILLRAMTSARGYLSPSLASQTPPMTLASVLGLQDIPRSASFSHVQVNGSRASALIAFRTGSKTARDQIGLTRTNGAWRIASIRQE